MPVPQSAEQLAERWVRALARRQLFGGGPEHIGRYRVTGHLGTGGMGVVLRATDERLGRDVALKLVVTEDATERSIARAEARSLASLSHPNIVEVFEVGFAGGAPFIAMELVDGISIDRWSKTEKTKAEIIHAMADAGRALASAHEAEIAHGDFKPTNVLVRPNCRVSVLDFGLAQRVAGPPNSELPGGGTPAFMAPEQFVHGPSPLADQFSFCVVLYQLLVGHPPFEVPGRKTLTGAQHRPRPLRSAKWVGVPRRVRAAILRGLRPDPVERFPSMSALVAELEHGSPWTPYAAVAALAGSLAAAVIFAGQSPVQTDDCNAMATTFGGEWELRTRPAVRAHFETIGTPLSKETLARVDSELSAFVQGFAAASSESCSATSVNPLTRACLADLRGEFEATTDVLLNLPPESMSRAVDVVTELHPVATCTSGHAPGRAIAAARADTRKVRQRAAELHALEVAKRYDDLLTLAPSLLADAQRLGDASTLATIEYDIGQAAQGRDPNRGIRHFERAYFYSAPDDTSAMAISAAQAVARTLAADLGRPTEARRWMAFADARLQRRDAPERYLQARGFQVRAAISEAEGRYTEAASDLDMAVQLLESESSSRRIEVMAARAQALHEVDRHDEELAGLLATQELCELHYGENHPRSAVMKALAGTALSELDEVAQGEKLVDEAIAVLEANPGPPHPYLALMYAKRAGAHLDSGQTAESIVQGLRAVKLFRQAPHVDELNLGFVLINLAQAYASDGQPDAAMDRAEEAVVSLEASLGSRHPKYAHALMVAGDAARVAGDFDAARSHLERAHELARASLGETHSLLGYILMKLGYLALDEGNPREALELARRAYENLNSNFGTTRAVVPRALAKVAWIHQTLAEYDEALAAWSGVQDLLGQLPNPPAGQTARANLGMAEAELELGSNAAAAEHATAGLAQLAKSEPEEEDVAEARAIALRALLASGRSRKRAQQLIDDALLL